MDVFAPEARCFCPLKGSANGRGATAFGASIWMLYPSKQYLPEKTRLFIDLAISSKLIRPT